MNKWGAHAPRVCPTRAFAVGTARAAALGVVDGASTATAGAAVLPARAARALPMPGENSQTRPTASVSQSRRPVTANGAKTR